MQKGKKLLDVVRDKIRFKHYSFSTEKRDINSKALKLYENSCYKVYGVTFYNKKKRVEFEDSFIKVV